MDDNKLSGLVEERDALQAALAATHNERAALQQQLKVRDETLAAALKESRIGSSKSCENIEQIISKTLKEKKDV